jgi:hypothetical protein
VQPAFIAVAWLLPGAVFAQGGPASGQPGPTPAGQARADAFFARVQDLQRRHSITIDGRDDPAAIARGTVLRSYFARFRAVDDTSFAQLALEEVGATGSDVEVLKEARTFVRDQQLAAPGDLLNLSRQSASTSESNGDLCASLLEGSLADADGVEIANHIVALEAESDRATAAPFEDIIDRLSPRVRANVLQGIDEVARGFVSTELDHLGMAHEDPDLYKALRTGLCRGRRIAAATASDAGDSNGSRAAP